MKFIVAQQLSLSRRTNGRICMTFARKWPVKAGRPELLMVTELAE